MKGLQDALINTDPILRRWDRIGINIWQNLLKMSGTSWTVYLIETSDGSLYAGISTDVERRFREHQGLGGKGKGAKYFAGRSPVAVRYTEVCENRSQASKREAQLKKMSARAKRELCQGQASQE